MMIPKISVIIPIYNREKTLNRCIDSVLSQDFPDFECILVDDGSKDGSLNICEAYAKKDNRIKVIHKENGGVGSARNAGIEKAKGEWLFFLDSDDFITENHLSSMFKVVDTHNNVDIVICSFQELSSAGKRCYQYDDCICTSREKIKEIICSEQIQMNTPWMNRMYRKCIVLDNNIRYDTTLPISEDRLFFYCFILHIRGLAIVHNDSYVIDSTCTNSLSKKQYSYDIISVSLGKTFELLREIIQHYEIESNLLFFFWKYHWDYFLNMVDSIYNVGDDIFSAIKKQKRFYNSCFDVDLYNYVKDDERINKYMSNRSSQDVLHQRFLYFNLRKLLRNFLIR